MTKDTLPPPAVLAAPEPQASTDDYDSPWKEAIETYFPEFLAFYFPYVHTAIDWQHTPVFLDKELRATVRDAESGKLYVDKLVRVVGRSGRSLCLYIHIEIQGTRQRIFAERMFVYHYRLFDRYRAPVVSLALLTDPFSAWQPRHFQYEHLDCRLRLDFPMVKLLDWRDRQDTLGDDDNPFALVTLAHLHTQATRRNMTARLQAKGALVKLLYRKGWDRQRVLDIFHVLDWMLHLPDYLEQQLWQNTLELQEEKQMRYVTSVERMGIAKGRQEGRQEGLHEGLQKGLQRLLVKRFGPLPPVYQERIRTASIEHLSAWFDQALEDPPSLEAVFEPLRH